jgi:hypothetical protein
MGQTTDQLRQEIDTKRDDAAAKIDAIEARVQDTAQMAKDTVEETMATAKDTVTETVTETVETIKQGFDFQKQVDERPLMMLGAAVLGGFFLERAMGGDKQHRSHYYQDNRSQPGPLQQAVHNSGLDTTMSAMTGAVAGMAAERLQGLVDETFPEFGQRLRQEMNNKSSVPRTEFGSSSSGLPPASTSSRSEQAYREPLA